MERFSAVLTIAFLLYLHIEKEANIIWNKISAFSVDTSLLNSRMINISVFI